MNDQIYIPPVKLEDQAHAGVYSTTVAHVSYVGHGLLAKYLLVVYALCVGICVAGVSVLFGENTISRHNWCFTCWPQFRTNNQYTNYFMSLST